MQSVSLLKITSARIRTISQNQRMIRRDNSDCLGFLVADLLKSRRHWAHRNAMLS